MSAPNSYLMAPVVTSSFNRSNIGVGIHLKSIPKVNTMDNQSGSVLQDWVTALPLRYQGTLLMALRGCDTETKFGPTKTLTRYYRYCIMNPADPREANWPGAFMSNKRPENMVRASEWDQVPLHWAMHMLHGIEIIAYCHPDPKVADFFFIQYINLCKGFHLNPESDGQLNDRLTEDRVAKGEVVS